MTTEGLITAYVFVLLCGVGALALYSEHRRQRFRLPASPDHIFRCEQCGFVYTDDGDVDRSRCPQCGTLNDEIKF